MNIGVLILFQIMVFSGYMPNSVIPESGGNSTFGFLRKLHTALHRVCECMLSGVQLFETPWTIACQTPLSMEFPRQEYWSRLWFPTPGKLSDPGIEPKSLTSPALAGGFLHSTDICPGVGMLAHIATIFSFLRNLHTFSIVAAPVYIPASNLGGFPFLHTLSSISYL